MSQTIHVTVNGAVREAEVETRMLLVDFLRETLGLHPGEVQGQPDEDEGGDDAALQGGRV